MNTDDLTLRAFLESKNLGQIDDTGADILEAYGHTPESAAGTEMLFLHPNKPNLVVQQFPALIAGYLFGLDFESIKISRLIPNKQFPPQPGAAQYLWKFEANDEDRGRSIITVTVFDVCIMFSSME